MKVWVLFVFMTYPVPQASTYDSKAECEKYADQYKRAVCVQVDVPKR